VKVIWSDQALVRLAEIREFVARDSPVAARRLLASLVDRGDSLSRLAQRGRLVPGFEAQGFRELIDGNYRLVYRISGDIVEILTVFERHRLLPEDDLP